MAASARDAVNAAAGEEVVENVDQERLYVYTHVATKMVQATAVLAPPIGLARQLSVASSAQCLYVLKLIGFHAWTSLPSRYEGIARM